MTVSALGDIPDALRLILGTGLALVGLALILWFLWRLARRDD